MSRKPTKPRASSGKTPASFSSPGSNSFGAFSTASKGAGLSYLAEPPDLSSISDSNVVVALKNLQKKDATTKSKALEELVAYVQAHPFEQGGGTEEPVLEAWDQLYPRISIENSRRVRELSHHLQFELMKSARKRMERHLPKIVASWLAGTFDRDKAVSRAATEGLSSFLTTPEKVVHFWRRCQPQILEYASEAIKETTETLSDTRSTNADDAETKYHRVLGSSLALVLNLIQKLDLSDLQKYQENYDQFFVKDSVWKSISVNDVVVRRLFCQLLSICLKKRPDRVEENLPRVSNTFIAEGLKCTQTGSTVEYVQVLTELTEKYPTIWTSDYHGKKSPSSRLKGFIEKGSQSSPVKFWDFLDYLLSVIPEDMLPKNLDSVQGYLNSMRSGVNNRDEPRGNALGGWFAYLNSAGRYIMSVDSDNDRVKLVQENIFPLTEHYLYPTPATSTWACGGQYPILQKAYMTTATSQFDEVVEATKAEWSQWKNAFITRIRDSPPETSAEHENYQKSVADEGARWFALTGMISAGHEKASKTKSTTPNIPAKYSLELLRDIFQVLETRKWKPFGAAAVVETAFKLSPRLFPSDDTTEIFDHLKNLLSGNGGDLLQLPSAAYLFSSINLLGEIPEQRQVYEEVWNANVMALLKHIEAPGAFSALTTLISTEHAGNLAQNIQDLQRELIRKCILCAVGAAGLSWDLFKAVFTCGALTDISARQLVKELGNRIANVVGEPNQDVIKGLRIIAEEQPDLLLQDEVIHMSLMTKLLAVSEQFDATSDITTLTSLMSTPSKSTSRLLGLVQQSISDANPSSLAIDTIYQQARKVHLSMDTRILEMPVDLIPDTVVWKGELALLLQQKLHPSLAATSTLGGAYFLPTSTSPTPNPSVRRDRDGCSIPGRMAIYITKFLSANYQLDALPHLKQVEIVMCLCLTTELVTDQLTAMSENGVWNSLSSGIALLDAEDLASSARKAINKMAQMAGANPDGLGTSNTQLMHNVVRAFVEEARSLTPRGLYCARATSELLQVLVEHQFFPLNSENHWFEELDILKNGPTTVLPAAAVLTGLGESVSYSSLVNTFYNRLVSDLIGLRPDQEKTLTTLVLLNACVQVYPEQKNPVANNRLLRAVLHVVSWLDTPEDLDYRFAAEVCRFLARILPCIQYVYGSHWERTVEYCIYLWTKPMSQPLDYYLPEIHASLRLFNSLKCIEKDKANEDIVDILEDSAERISAALIELLKLRREEISQPLEIVDSLLLRQVEKIPLDHVRHYSELFGLMASNSRKVQTAAFTILHRAVPAAQEKISVDALLEKKDAQLPGELLSLLLEAPILENYSDELLECFPAPIRSYLLSWLLVFDSFKAAAYKARSDYAMSLKTANYVGPLVEFIFDILGHSAARPLNLEKDGFTEDQIREYDVKLAEAETEERSMQWLLIHLYYLVLKFIPGIFKAWCIDCRSKQTKIAVASWTTKYFSPIIISDALKDVSSWSATQARPAEDEKELVVKVSNTTREVTAGYEIDDQQALISIRIPQEYPLEGVSVTGINRVAVNERKWQSWITTTQGVITLSGGSIIDGLTTFRRNIVGAMKGQSECAICYSIISTDRKMPDKRCPTCKNFFHRICLYKWFQSSNQNTCPLCRNQIDYLGADPKGRRPHEDREV
ncbi:hypothetical protein GGR54DRAFT_577131 [Hypoxylon sp. NC1633]|nr:hypothetical protein GGR54DRAFT_577131 [Hypoxylon sp. NC1633]